MSGFVAIASDRADPQHAAKLVAGGQSIAHRGDQETLTSFVPHCSVITRSREHSGYRTDTYANARYAIVIDGLLFNTDELRRAAAVDDSPDIARIVLEGFERFGDPWFARLEGSFALMVVDLQSREVILARDRFGHRPMFFAHFAGETWVASEGKAIFAASGQQRRLNTARLSFAITSGFTPGPQTIFRDIYKCVHGFAVRIDAQGRQKYTNYFTSVPTVRRGLSKEEGKEFILSALERNVSHYLEACPDLGIMLSGGVDSALLAHLATSASGGRTTAVSFGAKSWSKDESGDAKSLADRIGMQFKRSFVSPQDDILGSLTQVVSVLEEPTRFENAVALEMMTREAGVDCTALMTGEGADFILGMREHTMASRLTRILKIPGTLRSIARRLPLRQLTFGRLRGLVAYLDWQSVSDFCVKSFANCGDLLPGATMVPENEILALLDADLADWRPQPGYTYVVLRTDAHCWVERMEQLTSAAGMECFHAFESNDILQFGLEMPDHLRFAGGVSKPILRSLAADIFDDNLAYGEKKQLAAPMSLWLNESSQLREAVLDLRNANSRVREYLDNDAMDRYLDAYAREGADRAAVAVPIFRMLTFQIWLELFA